MKHLKRCFVFITLFVSTLMAHADSDPTPMIKSINDKVLSVLNAHQSELKANPKIIENAIMTYFIPHVDTQGMSRSVLGRNIWQKASDSEKSQFTTEFTKLVLRTYAQPLANYTKEKVEFLPKATAPVQRFSQVKSVIIRPNGQRIAMTYHLVLSASSEWKVYDLSVEGVSLLNSFRNQFGQALRADDLKTVIAKMHQKNTRALS